MIINKYKAIIFDWDGTLVNSEDWVVAAHNHVREAYGLPLWTRDDIFSSSSLSSRELYPKIYANRADEALQMLYTYTQEHNLEGAIPYENSKQLLEMIKTNNISQAVVSNKRHKPLNEAIDYLGWRDYFECAIGAGYCDTDKPSSAPLLEALKQMKGALKPADILYVGDTETDLLCAKNTGCDVAFIQSDKPRPDLIEKYNPTFSSLTLKDLLAQFKNAQKAA